MLSLKLSIFGAIFIGIFVGSLFAAERVSSVPIPTSAELNALQA